MEKSLLTGSFQWMKSLNKSVILNLIREKEPISRAEIAKLTKLTPPTVSNLVKELLETGIIIETELGESSGGRKPTLLKLNSGRFLIIGLDIGSHHLKVIVANLNGDILRKQVFQMPSPITNDGLLELMKKAIGSIQDKSETGMDQVLGIGVAMHGIVDAEEGLSIFGPNLKLKNIPIKEVLEQEFNIPVMVENDARAMSLGELWFGHGAGVDSLVCINVGRGIGAGIIIDGKIYRGQHDISGEIGHMTIDIDGPKCTCGNYGCLQTFASGPAIAEQVKKELRRGTPSKVTELAGDIDGVTGEFIYKAALLGDSLCQSVLNQAGRYLGVGITNLIHTINPERIIIGGGVSNASEFVVKNVVEAIEQRTLTQSARQTQIMASKFGEDATVIGAVALILVQIFSA
ncbi:ROK family transcriptional regulator [Bacillus sp. T33-2]|uniref:ROK family transcriptional regulator n=1 Tax=Bacillus sp. T33-2 TaxID=2054168 RepID=UPI000C774F0A|nr:ROK family transcriptional regulator [Bacillus sp. T33-2]PLR96926.1 sugar kinase [Bacillus sp. T33-2]